MKIPKVIFYIKLIPSHPGRECKNVSIFFHVYGLLAIQTCNARPGGRQAN